MDSVPFTLFFVVCLTVFPGIPAKPHIVKRSIEWPEKCAGKCFCTQRPADYPSEETLRRALNVSNIDFSILTPPSIDDRMSQELCPSHLELEPVYLIKDKTNTPRYAVQLPNIYQYQLRIEECIYDKDTGRNKVVAGFDDMVRCDQVTTPFTFLVLSDDLSKVQIAESATGIPTSCSSRFLSQ